MYLQYINYKNLARAPCSCGISITKSEHAPYVATVQNYKITVYTVGVDLHIQYPPSATYVEKNVSNFASTRLEFNVMT